MKNRIALTLFSTLALVAVLVGCKDHDLPDEVVTQKGLPLSSAQAGYFENPTSANGVVDMSYDKSTKRLTYSISYKNLPTPLYNANIRIAPRGQSGAIFYSFVALDLSNLSKTGSTTGYLDIPAAEEDNLLNGMFYVLLTTGRFTGIQLRSQIEFYDLNRNVVKKGIAMTSQQEVPSLSTPAKGTVDVLYNKNTKMLSYLISWENLADIPNGAHIHGTADRGVNAPVQHPFIDLIPKTRSGSFSNSVVVDGNKIKESELLNGKYYFNMHNSVYPAGEIRGQIEF